jgi:hypothetical protein
VVGVPGYLPQQDTSPTPFSGPWQRHAQDRRFRSLSTSHNARASAANALAGRAFGVSDAFRVADSRPAISQAAGVGIACVARLTPPGLTPLRPGGSGRAER